MSKFNSSTATAGGGPQTIATSAVQELTQSMPTLETSEQAATDSVIDPDLISAMGEVEAAPQVQPELEQIEQTEIERQARPGMKERYSDPEGGRWGRKGTLVKGKDNDGHGGIFSRANAFTTNVTNENIGMSSFMATGATDGLPVVLRKAGGVIDLPGKADYNQDFLAAMSIVTENWMADNFGAEQRRMEKDAARNSSSFNNMPDDGIVEAPKADTVIKKLTGNETLGQEIVREYQRIQGDQETTDVLSPDEAQLLGDAAKEMFALANPDMVQRQANAGSQTEFVLTPLGAEIMQKTERTRKRLFPKQQVRPATAPMADGRLKGEAKNYTTDLTGSVKPNSDSPMIAAAKVNASSIANVVDRQREKILYLSTLGILAGTTNLSDPVSSTLAEINSVGPSKMQGLVAKEKSEPEGSDFSATAVMGTIHNKLAEEIRSIAMERGGARYFTYYTTAYNGRISPQQSTFDATGAKSVRYVTRAAEPAHARKGNRIDKNLRQMYAMMLVSGNTSGIRIDNKNRAADMLLPVAREQALTNATPQLVAWGRRLRQLVEQGMTDSQLDAVAAAIQNGEKLTIAGPDGQPMPNPAFPQFTGLQFDPEADAALLREIKSKGEDGMHFIDGLIDFAKYHHAMETKGSYNSFFNAYFDGKTNGLAANGIQMGSLAIALRTGVVRYNSEMLLDDGDLRDELAKVLIETINSPTGGIDGVPTENSVEYHVIANAIFNHRDLNKWSTMTFGYGLDISSMAPAIEESASVIYEKMLADPTQEGALDYMQAYELIKLDPDADIGGTLLPTYSTGVVSVLSPEAIMSRSLMKTAAALAGFNDKLFTIMGPHGMPLHFGGKIYDENATPLDRQSYVVKEDGKSTKRTADAYPAPKKSAAANRNDTPGGKAMGGSVPGPIQATDAATVASLLSGKSWEKLKSASNGKPYIHTIYDAFKVDARSYDVALEEVNNNWYDINMKWSYLKEAKKTVDKNMEDIIKKMKKLDDKQSYDSNDFKMVQGLVMGKRDKEGNMKPVALTGFLKTTIELDPNLSPKDVKEQVAGFAEAMFGVFERNGIRMQEDTVFNLTGAQIKTVMREVIRAVNIQKRFTKMIADNEVAKKKLDAEIKRLNVPNYQYYAH